MSSTVDTNILIYASNELATEHAPAKALVDDLLTGPALTTLIWPVLLSHLRIVTHPGIFERPLPPEVATSAIHRLVSTIYTRDRGFRRFDGIRVIDPFAGRLS